MNRRIVVNYLGRILALDAICMFPSLIIALVKGESLSAIAFAITIAAQLLISLSLIFVKIKDKKMYAREGFVIVALSWITISVFGAFPLCFSGAIPNYLNALFETISGFTTTGATILCDIESLPMSVLYWRSFTHWLGGMGVLVLILALVSSNKDNGMPLHILRAESPGPSVGKFAPKITFTARILYTIYIAFTILEIIILLLGKMPFFDAVTTAFGTAGTGGFSIKNDSIVSYNKFCQTTIAIFMLLFGVNFSVYFFIIIGEWKNVLKNTELKVYLMVIAFATTAITLCLKLNSIYGETASSLHHSFFQVVSIITTTGFATADFNNWPEFTHAVMLLLMFMGACAGSTGGGLKISRLIILFNVTKAETRKMINPRKVYIVTVDGKPLEKGTDKKCFAYLFIYVCIIIVSVLIISLESSVSFKTNFTSVLSCFNNIGPGMDAVGPMSNYSFFSPLSKIVLMIDMLLGRLELFPLIIAFSPSTYSKRRF